MKPKGKTLTEEMRTKIKHQSKKYKRAPSYLKLSTGKEPHEWAIKIQKLIVKHSVFFTKGKLKGHGRSNTKAWINELAVEMEKAIKKNSKGPYDENMAVASMLGMVLVHWYARVHRAKSYDPRRPLWTRKPALKHLTGYTADLMRLIFDESMDAQIFPDQDWSPPFNPKAKEGEFV